MIVARLNGKGDIATPGAIQVLGRSLQMRRAGVLEIRAAGFLGLEEIVAHSIECSQDLAVKPGTAPVGQAWALAFVGAGTALLSFTTTTGRTWTGRVRVREG